MAVSNGQAANQTTFNNAFMSRTQNSNTLGIQNFENTDLASGPSVINIQREINSLNSYTGRISGSAFDANPAWINTDVGTSSDSIKQRADLLTAKFNLTTGHKHTGAVGDAPPLDDSGITSPLQGFAEQGDNLNVSGTTHDVSTELALKEPSLNASTKGIPVNPENNEVGIKYADTFDEVEDGSGNLVYGRLTNTGGLGGTWTLSFYSIVSGAETAYSFSSPTDISWWYQELFHPLESTRPVYSQMFNIPSRNATSDVVDATEVQAGKVSVSTQNFGGVKNFYDGMAIESANVPSAATITALSSSKPLIRITGALNTEVQGIAAPVSSKNLRLVISNVSSADTTFKHQNGGALAANRIISPDGDDIVVPANSSIEFFYDVTQSRWLVLSSGVGSGGAPMFQESLGTGNGVMVSFGPLTEVPVNDESVAVFVDGILEDKANWSLAGQNVVFSVAPALGQHIYVWYAYDGTPPVLPVPTGTEQVEYRTITGGEETAKQLTLGNLPASPAKVVLDVIGGGPQEYAVDYTVSGTVLDWAGYGLDGYLVAGDRLRIHYWS